MELLGQNIYLIYELASLCDIIPENAFSQK